MKIKWVGPDRFTKWGLGTVDSILDVPDNVGQSFIDQGLAVIEVDTPKSKKVSKEETK